MAESLVERLAKVIYESQFADRWRGGFGTEAELFRQSARAAIACIEDKIEARLIALNSACDAMLAIGNRTELDDLADQITRTKQVRDHLFGVSDG